MNIKDLDRNISRLSYLDRAKLCENISKERLGYTQPKSFLEIDGTKEAYNFELELLAFRSAIGSETAVNYYTPLKWFNICIKQIRSQKYLDIIYEKRNTDDLITSLSFMQFAGQQSYSFLIYRYDFMFTFVNERINMNQIFLAKFKIPYSDFEAFVFLSHVWATLDKKFSFSLINNILTEPMKRVLKYISTTREQIYIDYLNITSGDEIYSFFDLNLLLKTPFVKEDKRIFCFYAPFIPYACTQSLMFDITENKEDLRSLIGKNVVEEYVFNIVSKSKVTNQYRYLREFYYKKKKLLSPDVIILSSAKLLFLEVKFFNQGLRLRKFDKYGVDEANRKLSEGLEQLYRAIYNLDNGLMDVVIPNGSSLTSYGFLVTYDEYYFSRADAYKLAASSLLSKGYSITSEELKENIRIFPLSSLENLLYHSSDDIFDYCEKLFGEIKNWDDKFFAPFNYDENKNNMPLVDKLFLKKRDHHKNNIMYCLKKKPE